MVSGVCFIVLGGASHIVNGLYPQLCINIIKYIYIYICICICIWNITLYMGLYGFIMDYEPLTKLDAHPCVEERNFSQLRFPHRRKRKTSP